jgi:carboxylesterase type B
VLQNFGAFHGIELFYLFQQMTLLDGYAATAADQRVEAAMASYWGSFARNGHPNGAEGVARTQWETFSPEADNVLNIDKETTQLTDPRASECEFWDQFSGA